MIYNSLYDHMSRLIILYDYKSYDHMLVDLPMSYNSLYDHMTSRLTYEL